MWQIIDQLVLSLSDTVILRLIVFVLVLCRFSGLFLAAPFFGSNATPVKVKAGMAVLFALCVVPLVDLPALKFVNFGDRVTPMVHFEGSDTAIALSGRFAGIIFFMASEVAIGLIFGLAVSLFFTAVQFAGHVLGQQMGFAIANVIDPISNMRVSVVGQLNYLLAVGVFLSANLHLELIGIMQRSFKLVPLGVTLQWEKVGLILVKGLGGTMWEFALRVALPGMLGVFLITVGLGFLTRAVPQINVFIVGFGIKILVGLWLLYIGVPIVVDLFREGMDAMIRNAGGLFTWARSG